MGDDMTGYDTEADYYDPEEEDTPAADNSDLGALNDPEDDEAKKLQNYEDMLGHAPTDSFGQRLWQRATRGAYQAPTTKYNDQLQRAQQQALVASRLAMLKRQNLAGQDLAKSRDLLNQSRLQKIQATAQTLDQQRRDAYARSVGVPGIPGDTATSTDDLTGLNDPLNQDATNMNPMEYAPTYSARSPMSLTGNTPAAASASRDDRLANSALDLSGLQAQFQPGRRSRSSYSPSGAMEDVDQSLAGGAPAASPIDKQKPPTSITAAVIRSWGSDPSKWSDKQRALYGTLMGRKSQPSLDLGADTGTGAAASTSHWYNPASWFGGGKSAAAPAQFKDQAAANQAAAQGALSPGEHVFIDGEEHIWNP